jgi:hypothetical protein
LAIWKIINEENAVMIPKNRVKNFSSGLFHSELFGRGGVICYAATPLIVALSPVHIDISWFCPWSPIATGNYWDRAGRKKILKVSQTTGTVELDPFRHFGTHLAGASACPDFHE